MYVSNLRLKRIGKAGINLLKTLFVGRQVKYVKSEVRCWSKPKDGQLAYC